MTARLRTVAACDAAAAQQFAPWRDPEYAANVAARADAEWDAMDANGYPPIGWVNPIAKARGDA